jgi:hypothetical protein
MIYNYFFNKQKVGLEERPLLFNRHNNLYLRAITKNCFLILPFIASFIRLVYPILLVTTIMQSISFSSFSKDFTPKKEEGISEKGRFEIENLSVNSKQLTLALQSIKETEQLLNDYSKANHNIDVNILDKINITFLSDIQMKGAMGAFSAEGTTQKPTIYLNTDWLNTGISSFDVTKVLIEEYGHYLDSKYSSSDRVGDEGELFANIVLGNKISTSDLMRIMIENDHNSIDDNGKIVAVEQATVYFNTVYKGTGSSYGVNTQSITNIQPFVGSGFRFISADPAATSFSGNNIAGNFVYSDINSVQQTIPGIISRQSKTGNDVDAFIFYPVTTLGGTNTTGDAYVLVVPIRESSITASSNVATSSDNVDRNLNLELTRQSSPSITSNGTLSPFSTCAGIASNSQTFTISGTGLTANIVLTAPTGYELSLGGTIYSSPTLSISQVGGVVTSTTVYVRLKSNATNGASGNVSATSTGATTINVATGTGVVTAIPSAPSGAGSNCGTGTVSMTASGCVGGTISWYGSLTGGSALSTGNNFTTPSISTTTTYYIDCTVSGCTSSSRSSALATITTIPSAATSTGGSNCGTGTVSMTASGCVVQFRGMEPFVVWSTTTLTGGSALSTGNGTGTEHTTPSISTLSTHELRII